MPVYGDNSGRLLKVVSTDQEIVCQRPKVFGGLRRLQFAVVTIVLHPSLECWVWQLYFTKTKRTFTVNMYSSDLFALDDSILHDPYVLNSEN